jgi:hypothetical protein
MFFFPFKNLYFKAIFLFFPNILMIHHNFLKFYINFKVLGEILLNDRYLMDFLTSNLLLFCNKLF